MGIVRAHQAEQGGLSRAVLSGQGPAFAPAHGPIQVAQDGAVVVADAHTVEAHHLVGRVVLVGVGQGEDAFLQVVAGGGGQSGQGGEVVPAGHLGQDGLVLHGDDVGDERGNVVRARHHEDDLQRPQARQLVQEFEERVPRVGVQPDEGVVHDEDEGACQQGLGYLELAQLAAGEQDDALVQQGSQAEDVEEAVRQLRMGRGAQQVAHQGDFVLVVGIPPLLVVVVGVGAAVGVAEGDVLHIIIYGLVGGRAEVIVGTSGVQGILAGHQVHQQALSGSVGSCDGDVFIEFQLQADGCGEAHLRVACHGFRQADGVGWLGHIIRFWSRKDTDFPLKRNKKGNFVRRLREIAYLCRPQKERVLTHQNRERIWQCTHGSNARFDTRRQWRMV